MTVQSQQRDAEELYSAMTLESSACPVCESREHVEVLSEDRYGMGVRTAACYRCGMVFTNPRPSGEDLARFYRDHYREFYFDWPDPNESSYRDSIQFTRAAERAEFAVRFTMPHLLERVGWQKSARILDVGCGDGAYLAALREVLGDASLCGTEPSPAYAEYAALRSGAKVQAGSLTQFIEQRDSSSEGFDLVVLSHALEHIADPVNALKTIATLLSEQGLLYVEVPNIESPHWHGLMMFHIAHLLQFSPATLRNCVGRAGFCEIKTHTATHPVNKWGMCFLFERGGGEVAPAELEFPSSDLIEDMINETRKRAVEV